MTTTAVPVVTETIPEDPLDSETRYLLRIVDLTAQIIEVLDRALADDFGDPVVVARLTAIREEEARRVRDLEPLLRSHLRAYGSISRGEPW